MNFKTFLKPSVNWDIFNEHPDGIIIIDFKKNIKFWNKRAQEIFGYSKNEITDKSISIIFEGNIEELYKTIGSTNGTVIGVKTKNGSEIYVDITSSDSQGHDEVLIAVRNVSEKQKLIQNVLENYEQTKTIVSKRDSFITNMAYEITNPLHSIIGFSQALLDGLCGPINEKQTKYSTIINTNGRKLSKLMEKIIDLTTLESNKKEFKFKNFDVIKTVEFSAETIIPLCEAKKIEFVSDYTLIERRNCYCDEQALRQVLMNILDNALKFTESGSIKVKLAHPELEFVQYQGLKVPPGYSEKSFVHFSVEDTGIGIPESELNSIFDEYRQIDKAMRQKYSGSGLSLAITRKIVEKLDGVIWVESELLKGSILNFIIPIERIRFSDLEG